ncbi:hypothetical protein RJ40_05250 [Methanofollis aquaemaris]|uniref:Uncharacterized protein n=1 Tax=Methanofollis aquaemaris TaxID=126734 RepID=A0A8A3S5D6_9EURY|nr:hypothetical protein [Methanofollis aquaemaris]QSZ66941.1 hypothetical protein RJ40_05250 [Methanofollis aquaemaris]
MTEVRAEPTTARVKSTLPDEAMTRTQHSDEAFPHGLVVGRSPLTGPSSPCPLIALPRGPNRRRGMGTAGYKTHRRDDPRKRRYAA